MFTLIATEVNGLASANKIHRYKFRLALCPNPLMAAKPQVFELPVFLILVWKKAYGAMYSIWPREEPLSYRFQLGMMLLPFLFGLEHVRSTLGKYFREKKSSVLLPTPSHARSKFGKTALLGVSRVATLAVASRLRLRESARVTSTVTALGQQFLSLGFVILPLLSQAFSLGKKGLWLGAGIACRTPQPIANLGGA